MKYLLVDDHPIVRSGLRRLMQGLGPVEVVEADCGREAFRTYQATHPDVVLIDVNLPGMGGFQLLRRLLAETPDLSAASRSAPAMSKAVSPRSWLCGGCRRRGRRTGCRPSKGANWNCCVWWAKGMG
jgi:DNA-binding NarL/FixJ family response regulator